MLVIMKKVLVRLGTNWKHQVTIVFSTARTHILPQNLLSDLNLFSKAVFVIKHIIKVFLFSSVLLLKGHLRFKVILVHFYIYNSVLVLVIYDTKQ